MIRKRVFNNLENLANKDEYERVKRLQLIKKLKLFTENRSKLACETILV